MVMSRIAKNVKLDKAERLKAGGLLQPLEIPNGKWEKYLYGFHCWIATY